MVLFRQFRYDEEEIRFCSLVRRRSSFSSFLDRCRETCGACCMITARKWYTSSTDRIELPADWLTEWTYNNERMMYFIRSTGKRRRKGIIDVIISMSTVKEREKQECNVHLSLSFCVLTDDICSSLDCKSSEMIDWFVDTRSCHRHYWSFFSTDD